MVARAGRGDPRYVRRLQGSAGQATVEWLVVMVGRIALAGVLATTLPGVAGTITSAARSMICKVGATSCGGSSSSSRPAQTPQFQALDDTAPTHGPIIGYRPGDIAPGLPFPGSVSVTIDKNQKGSTGDDPKAGYKVAVSAKFERSTSPCSIAGEGKPTVTLATSADIKVEEGVNGEAKGVGAAIKGSIGDKTSYEIKTDPGNADQINRGAIPPPNPADPRSIPKGSSIVLNHDSYSGVDGEVTYRNITAELGYKEGHRVSSAVQRTQDDTVRITVGDATLVENPVGLKVGDEHVAAGITFGNGFEDGKARSVDLDISSPDGWDAYQAFITTGKLPAAGAPGTSKPTTTTSDTSTHTETITGKLGPLGGTAGGTTPQSEIVETRNADGSTETTYSRRGNTVAATKFVRVPDGTLVGEQYALQLQDVDKSYVDGYQQLSGQTGESNSNRDLMLSYSADDLDAMQNAALDPILAAQRGMNGSPFSDGGTRADLRAYLAGHPGGEGLAPTAGPKDQVILTDMAAANEPVGVLAALLNSGVGNATSVVDFLMHFHQGTVRARQALGSNDTASPLPGGYENRAPGC
jgi:hypothetical protein